MLKSDQAACQFAQGSLLMSRLLATRSRRTTSRKNNCVRDLRESWVSFTVLTDDRSPRIGCPVFQLLTDPPRLFPPAAGLFRLACASHVAFEGFLIPCSGFGGSSVSSLETSFLLSSGCLPSARVWTWSTEIPCETRKLFTHSTLLPLSFRLYFFKPRTSACPITIRLAWWLVIL